MLCITLGLFQSRDARDGIKKSQVGTNLRHLELLDTIFQYNYAWQAKMYWKKYFESFRFVRFGTSLNDFGPKSEIPVGDVAFT